MKTSPCHENSAQNNNKVCKFETTFSSGQGKGVPLYPGGPRSSLKVAKARVNESKGILSLGRLPLTI